jgi:hypothetical protein
VEIIREESPEEDDMFSTFSKMVIDSKEKLEKNTPVGQLNRIPESRKDVIFDYLRTIEKDFSLLEKQVGKFIPLPVFGDEESPYVPKDFLSEQRFQILRGTPLCWTTRRWEVFSHLFCCLLCLAQSFSFDLHCIDLFLLRF